MPELPEVETIKRELKAALVGRKISSCLVHNPKVIRLPSRKEFVSGIAGWRIEDISRLGKALIFKLKKSKAIKFLVVHLRMSGQLIYPGNGAKSRVSFKFSDGQLLDFNDQRLLGELILIDDWRQLSFFKRLGPEPFKLQALDFHRMLRKKKSKIKSLLMDQSFIAGVGNIYAVEALFRAKVNPRRAAFTLTGQEANRLLDSINFVLNRAIKLKGSSIDQYVRSDGEKGNFSKEHKVYDREGKLCFGCKSPIQRITLAGRGTYFCARCQR